jgi:hypothetical protein
MGQANFLQRVTQMTNLLHDLSILHSRLDYITYAFGMLLDKHLISHLIAFKNIRRQRQDLATYSVDSLAGP